MALTREQKKKILENLKEKVSRQKVMLFVSIAGLKVKDIFDLRKKLKKVDSQMMVAKKTLAGIAFKEKGIGIDIKKVPGEAAVIFGFGDEMLPAKAVYEFSKTNQNIKILGGFFEKKFREAEEIITLGQLPTKEELLARLVGSIAAPTSNFVNVLQGNIKGLINVLSEIKR